MLTAALNLTRDTAAESDRTGRATRTREAEKEGSRERGPRLYMPDGKKSPGTWLAGHEEKDLEKKVRDGDCLRVWIEPQENLPGLKTAGEAVFFVFRRWLADPDGLDIDALLLGARTPALTKALGRGPFNHYGERSERGVLHLCGRDDCLGLRSTNRGNIKRIHAIAIRPCLLSDVKDKFCTSGIKTLEKVLADDNDLVRPRRPQRDASPPPEKKARIGRLIDEVGGAGSPAGGKAAG